jgi:hypothetical protein
MYSNIKKVKTHVVVNEESMPLNVVLGPGNEHDMIPKSFANSLYRMS